MAVDKQAALWIKDPLAILANGAKRGVVVRDGRIAELVAAGRSPAAPDFAISRVICITVRNASVGFAWRDIASAMWRVTTGSTSFDDCRRQSFGAAAIA